MKHYQPKVSTTQQYSDSQGEHVVCKGGLVLIEELDPKKKHSLWRNKNGQLLHTTTSTPEQLTALNPIIISETESMYSGDMAYGGLTDQNEIREIKDDYGGKRPIKAGNFNLSKVLALPEHFSDKHLQAIVDVKIKDGDEVLVKCEWRGKCEECQKAGMYNCAHFNTCGNVVDFTQIHLDQQNHITLFPVQQSLEEAANEYKNRRVEYTGSGYFDTYSLEAAFKAGAKWAVKNNYKGE